MFRPQPTPFAGGDGQFFYASEPALYGVVPSSLDLDLGFLPSSSSSSPPSLPEGGRRGGSASASTLIAGSTLVAAPSSTSPASGPDAGASLSLPALSAAVAAPAYTSTNTNTSANTTNSSSSPSSCASCSSCSSASPSASTASTASSYSPAPSSTGSCPSLHPYAPGTLPLVPGPSCPRGPTGAAAATATATAAAAATVAAAVISQRYPPCQRQLQHQPQHQHHHQRPSLSSLRASSSPPQPPPLQSSQPLQQQSAQPLHPSPLPLQQRPGLPASSTATAVAVSTANPTPHNRNHNHYHHSASFQHHLSHSLLTMEQEPQDQHGVEAQQAAAKDYQPVLEGPFVGDKVSSDAITEEYAKADPVYVEKTLALSQAYSHYRRIQGDGNCGWRAIGFSYFEKLIDHGDQGQIEGEVARLTSLNNMLATVGGYSYYEDFFETFADLLRDVAASMPNIANAHMIALQHWNDESTASSLIYYLRLLAATYLKANAANYDPFVPGGVGVVGYCSSNIELPNREIEHLGINGLANVLLKPVNFVLDIAYLDRSAGDAVNSYRFPEDTNEQDPSTMAAMIHLLYRPDHYDIIYPAPPTPVSIPVPPQAPMQVHRVNGFSHNLGILQTSMGGFSTVDFSPMANIPSFSPAVLTPLAPPLPSPMSDTYAGSLQHHQQQPHQHQPQPLPNSWMAPFTDDMERSPVSSNQPAMVSPPLSVSALSRGGSIDSSIVGSGLTQQHAAAGPPTPGYQIRFSPVQLEYDEGKRDFPEQAFHLTTSTFKNSVYNRAHFGNPDFHPEEWCPDDEGIDSRVGGKRKIKKET